MAQKDVGNKVPIYKLKETKEVMDFYDEWGLDNKYDKDCVAVMPVHFCGHPVEMDKLILWAKERKLKVFS